MAHSNLTRFISLAAIAALSLQSITVAYAQTPVEQTYRVKDIASIGGVRSNPLLGYGIVVGLNGTGDGNVASTNQTIQSLMQRFGLTVDVNSIQAKNTAAVMVTAELPPFAKPGQKIDVTISALGKAQSLKGGSLLFTQLVGSDNETYAVAQGNLAVGGLGVGGNDGSKVTVNIPTVGRIPGGATVERVVPNPFGTTPSMMVNLNKPDFTNAQRLSNALNKKFGSGTALALDSITVRVNAPKDPDQRVSFMAAVEETQFGNSTPPARVIVNSRTGTIVISEGVRVTPAAVSHGSLTVRIKENQNVTPNAPVIGNAAPATVTPNTQISVDQPPARTFLFAPDIQLASIVDAINAVGATSSDLVAILEALKEAGALHAELVVI
ncbi:MAG: flagellar basal body P-ring protein FlgI [Methylocystaceae bacterium]|nr:flagellar basal body P-ring protein FlgI [Methylocystaceae bacterium]